MEFQGAKASQRKEGFDVLLTEAAIGCRCDRCSNAEFFDELGVVSGQHRREEGHNTIQRNKHVVIEKLCINDVESLRVDMLDYERDESQVAIVRQPKFSQAGEDFRGGATE